MSKNRVLGKGLSALIQGADLKGGPVEADSGQAVLTIALGKIGFDPRQPRKSFNDNTLEELAASIGDVGILQPVLVRHLREGETVVRHPGDEDGQTPLEYCVVAGERRLRAARLAGLDKAPALVCSFAETEALKVALLENIQREDLGPVEEATAYRELMEAYGATQEELASMLGKKRSSVANMLRLLALEPEILDLLQGGQLSTGHAKALLGLEPGPARLQLAKRCHSRGLSVRECERRVQAGGARFQRKRARKRAGSGGDDPIVRAYTGRAEQVYGSPVAITRDAQSGKGAISVRFYSDDDLIRLLKIMGVDTEL